MVIKENEISVAPDINWIGSSHIPNEIIPHLVHKNAFFYKKCIFGPLSLRIGDYVLVSNADAAEPDSVDGCDIGKILYLYELREMSDKDPYRAIVQWYSRPQCLPHKEFDSDHFCIDFNIEVIEEHRPYDADISLETIFRKCIVICGRSEDSAQGLLKTFDTKHKSCPMFVCRYKFVKVKKAYRLVPLQFANNELSVGDDDTVQEVIKAKSRRKSCVGDGAGATPKAGGSARKVRKPKFAEEKRRRASVSAGSAVEFIDIDYFENLNKVSPIKIIGGRSVVRLSVSAKKNSNSTYSTGSPLAEKNAKVNTPTSRAAAARRNLNLSLDNGANNNTDSDCLNYSIVKNAIDEPDTPNNIKIKLRISERRRSNRLASMDELDPLAIERGTENTTQTNLKRLGATETCTPNNNDIYHTPSKKSKGSGDHEMTPATRRKSILKSATTRLAEGTPRRSIQLSNIVEKRVFQDDDIISTPKRRHKKKVVDEDINWDEDYQDSDKLDLKKSAMKNSIRARRNSTRLESIDAVSAATTTSMTPTQKLKLIRSGEISPTMKQRRLSALTEDRGKSDLQVARERLHVSAVPKSLPCREKEFNNIYTFLEGKIQDRCGGCMYVSGVPGTGKTATVTGVIRMLQSKVANDELEPFEFLEINGMRLTEPRQAYVHIYKQLTGKTVSWEHAHSLLEKRFTTSAPRRVTTVLLVDELDILCNRRQDVVYNLLDWPTKSAARLVVITIANTMDLPERLLMGKVTSRLGLTRLTFQPYTHKQLQEIVTTRLSGSEAFKGDAIQLVARKVAAVSGDARRALDICRRSTEIADHDPKTNSSTMHSQKCVNMIHVQQALGEMIASAKVQAIKNCSRIGQIFLQAVAAEVTRTGVEETAFLGVYSQVETIAAFMGVPVPAPGKCLRICSKLGSERLLICEHSRNDIFQKILLNVSMDDIHYALRVNSAASI